MRRAVKYPDSEIVRNHLNYKPTNSSNNKKIAQILLKEQKKFCAYTDEFISRTDSTDIEHFDPSLKNTVDDNYNNWFLVKHQWNQEKVINGKIINPYFIQPLRILKKGLFIWTAIILPNLMKILRRKI